MTVDIIARQRARVLEQKLVKAKKWIEKHCCEAACEPKRSREFGCFSCEAWEFLETL